MRAGLISLLLVVSAPAFAASDYAREKKWVDEITPTIVFGDPLYLQQKNQHKFLALYTESPNARMGVVVAHGSGIHPDWGLIGSLRQRLADLGYTTLSIQMPVLGDEYRRDAYLPTFPEAAERLQLAVDHLKGKGYKRIALVSHSMGSRMSHAYMARNPAGVDAWVSIGIPDTNTYAGIKTPVLDLYGANDLPIVLSGAAKRRASLKGKTASKQMVMADSDHFFTGHEAAMAKVVKDYLDGLK
jgi:dienelactone hydrolase